MYQMIKYFSACLVESLSVVYSRTYYRLQIVSGEVVFTVPFAAPRGSCSLN